MEMEEQNNTERELSKEGGDICFEDFNFVTSGVDNTTASIANDVRLQKMDIIEKKIEKLEKIIIELAEWTNFDLQSLARKLDFNIAPSSSRNTKKYSSPSPRSNRISPSTTDSCIRKSYSRTRVNSFSQSPTTLKAALLEMDNDSSNKNNTITERTKMFNLAKKSTAAGVGIIGNNQNKKKRNYFPDCPARLELVQPNSEDKEQTQDNWEMQDIKLEEQTESIYFDVGYSIDCLNDQVQTKDKGETDKLSSGGSDFELQPDYENGSESDNPSIKPCANVAERMNESDILENTEGRKSKRHNKSKEPLPNPSIRLKKLRRETLLKEYKIKLPPKQTREPDTPKVRQIRSKGPFHCPLCPTEIFKTRYECVIHKKTVHKKPPKIYTCEFCQKTSRFKQKHENHLRTHTNERPYLCTICGFTTKTSQMLNSHNLIHNDEREAFPCNHCNNTFKSKLNLRTHIKKIHNINNNLQRQCPICQAVFADNFKLKRHHSDVHEDERPLICHLCGQGFKRRAHLNQHVIRHNNPKRRIRGPQKPMTKKKPSGSLFIVANEIVEIVDVNTTVTTEDQNQNNASNSHTTELIEEENLLPSFQSNNQTLVTDTTTIIDINNFVGNVNTNKCDSEETEIQSDCNNFKFI